MKCMNFRWPLQLDQSQRVALAMKGAESLLEGRFVGSIAIPH
jgi:hypothetical protein